MTGNVTGDLRGDVYAGLATATGGFIGNINSSGVSTITQIKSATIASTGLSTARGYVANVHSFMGNLKSGGISTTTYLQSTHVNASGIITASSYYGDGTNLTNTGSTLTQPSTGTQRLVTTSQTTGKMTSSGTDSVLNFNFGTHTLSSTNFAGALTGNVTGNVTGNTTGEHIGNVRGSIESTGISTFTNRVVLESSDGNPGRMDFYCETGNAHYTRIQAAPHAAYSGNVTARLPVKTGEFIVGDTVGAIDQNIHTSGIITATTFSGNFNGTVSQAASVLVTATNTTNATHYVAFSDSTAGHETMRSDIALTFNPSTDTLSCTTFAGNLTGSASGLTGSPDITVEDIICHNILPAAHNTYSIGSNAVRFANIYAADMHFSNKNATPNSVDNTTGDWTLQEGENDIFMINNITGKKYKINLTEV